MMMVQTSAPIPPALAGLRQASERWAHRERTRPRLGTGVAMLDALLGGGWPQGKVGELTGRASSGRSAVAAATVAAATARGEVTAWLDPADAFDPVSAAAAGVDLARVLWVRPRGIEETVRAAELVLETGGFTVVVLDLGSAAAGLVNAEAGRAPARGWARGADGNARGRSWTAHGRGRGALRLRLARAAERAGAVALVLAERPWAGTLAGVAVALGRSEARWGGEGREPRWLEGVVLSAQVERGRVGAGDQATARDLQTSVIARPRSGRSNPEATAMATGSPRLPRGAREPRDDSLGGGEPRPTTNNATASGLDVGAALAAARESGREAAAEAALGA